MDHPALGLHSFIAKDSYEFLLIGQCVAFLIEAFVPGAKLFTKTGKRIPVGPTVNYHERQGVETSCTSMVPWYSGNRPDSFAEAPFQP